MLFERHLRGAGTWNYRWPEDELEKLRQIVSSISYWAGDGHSEQPHPLRLDDSRLPEADEAWLPVVTPDGAGILVWPNSD